MGIDVKIYDLWEKYSSDAAFESYMTYNNFRRAVKDILEQEKSLLIKKIIDLVESNDVEIN